MAKYTIQPMTEQQAKNANLYYKVQPNDTEKDINNLINNYNQKFIFIKTRKGVNIIVDMGIKHANMFATFNPTTGDQTHEIITQKDVIGMCLQAPNSAQEIYGPKSSIFLDEHNLQKHLKTAKETQKIYGSEKIEDMNITGDQYLAKIQQLVDIAHDIIKGALIPNIFDLIPVKKNGTFQKDRKIVIFKNGISEGATYDYYVTGRQLALCIIPYGAWEYGQDFNMSEEINETRARLAIACIDEAKKLYPLLDKDFNIQDIKTKTTYLKNDQVKAGCIYKEKSGTEYLYFGEICTTSIDTTKLQSNFQFNTGVCHNYMKITKKLMEIIDNSHSLDDVLIELAKTKIKKKYDDFTFSVRANPRKFIEESATPFLNQPWININPTNIAYQNVKPIFTKTVKDHYNQDVSISYIIFGNI